MGDSSVEAGSSILENADRLARLIATIQYEREPAWRARFGEAGYASAVEDTRYHILVLGQAMAAGMPDLLRNYVRWAAILLRSRGISVAHFDSCLFGHADSVFKAELPPEHAEVANQYVADARSLLADPIEIPASHLPEAGELEPLARSYLTAQLAGDCDKAENMIKNAHLQGVTAEELYLQVLAPCQREVGRLWQVNEISIGHEHLCTSATQRIASELCASLHKNPARHGTAVVACVGGELHDVGSRMVADFLKASGWVTYYLGQNTPGPELVKMLEMTGAHLLALSCTTCFQIKFAAEAIASIRRHPTTTGVRIMLGGRAFANAEVLPEKLGADGYAADAASACLLAASFRLRAD